MKKHICWVLLTLVSMDAWAARNDAPAADSISKKSLSKIAFGSCAEEYKPQPILNTVV